jgi:Cu-Zn family superoxide dismutase
MYRPTPRNPWRVPAVVSALAACALTSGLAAQPATQATHLEARAVIKGEGVEGTATFKEVDAKTGGLADAAMTTGTTAVEIELDVSGLKPGAHGVHLHAIGKCDSPAFVTAGGHFDPGPAGNTDPDANHPFHMGDLPNLVADVKGHAVLKTVTTRVTLGPGPLSLFDADGTAIIVHGNPDQGTTGESKSGVSGGPRIACGVIEKR